MDSLTGQSFKNYWLILVDDGSVDGTGEMVRKSVENSVILKGNGNWWWAGSIQQAYNWIRRNVFENQGVLIINDDLIFDSNYLELGFAYLKENQDSMVLSAAYSQFDRDFLEDCGVIYDFNTGQLNPKPMDRLMDLNCASTRGLFLTSKKFIETKGMRPLLLPHYFSDYEFSIRANRVYNTPIKCYLDLKVYMNNETSGLSEIRYSGFSDYIKKVLDKRYKESPIYTFIFFVLAFPFPNNLKLGLPHLNNFFKTAFRLLIKA